MEVLNLLNKLLKQIQSNKKLSIVSKQKYLLKLQQDLNKNYIPSAEYKRFQIVLQNYMKFLKRKYKTRNISYFKETGFGDVIVNTNTLKKTNYLVNIQNIFRERHRERHNTVDLNIKDYLYKGTEYTYNSIPFIGSKEAILIFNN